MHVVTAEQMKALDRRTIEEAGIPGAVLMENAGRGTFEHMLRLFPDALSRRTAVVCGRGNNGGDGFVIARLLHNAGARVRAFLLAEAERVAGDARINLEAFRSVGGDIAEITDEASWENASGFIAHAGLFVDALLGTGLSSAVTGLYRTVIEDINAAMGKIVSVDIPSGLDATTGAVLGTAVKAHLTCTCGLPKRGLLVYPGCGYAGDLEVVDIGIPNIYLRDAGISEFLLDQDMLAGLVPPRRPESHKGDFGHVCLFAGSPGKTGAAALAAQTAARAGAGLVTLGTAQSLNTVLEVKLTEAMTAPLPDGGTGLLGPAAITEAEKLIAGKTAVAVGPGIGTAGGTREFVAWLLEAAQCPVVIDADGISCAAEVPGSIKKARCPVLTPHPGEMARFTGASVQDVQSDRIGCARACAAEHGAVVVLKGARTIVAAPDGTACINPTGNPGMASGGMGDVLTGLIAALMAQGVPPLPAAQLGVYAHGMAADRAARESEMLGLQASDLIRFIPGVLTAFCDDATG